MAEGIVDNINNLLINDISHDHLLADAFKESFSFQDIQDDLSNSINCIKNKLLIVNNVKEPLNKRKRSNENDDETVSKDFSYYGLPSKIESLLKKYRGISKIYDWQDECLNLTAIKERKNLIYALPTSGGKTLVAELLMLKEIICNKKNAIFVLPFVALVQEKIQAMMPFALELNFLIEEYAGEKGHFPPKKRRKKNTLYVCTIEKAHSLINFLIESNRLNEVGISVIDELHLLGEDGGRGANLEVMLTKLMHFKSNIHIVAMSATIGNLEEISKFLNAELYQRDFRPVQLVEHVKCANVVWVVDTAQEEVFTGAKYVDYKYGKKHNDKDPDHLGGLVMEVVPEDSCLIFCSNKKNCENVALLVTSVLGNLSSLKKHKTNEKLALIKSLQYEDNFICPILKKTIMFGVAYHHSGLTSEERRLIEDSFKMGTLCVICCTSTLAAGVNLPAKRVILRSPYVGKQLINLGRYKQMVGRAGRAGFGEYGESFLIFNANEKDKVKELLSSKMSDSISSLHTQKDTGIENLITSTFLLSKFTTRSQLQEIMEKSLLKIQEKSLNTEVYKETNAALIKLIEMGTIKIKTKTVDRKFVKPNLSVIIPSQIEVNSTLTETITQKTKIKIPLKKDTELELSPLGKAALKGSINLNTAYMLYEDLKKAQNKLILVDYLHLLYLVTPYDIAKQISVIGHVYYDVVNKLENHQREVAETIGITGSVTDKIFKGMLPKNASATTIQRFYSTLILSDLWKRMSTHQISVKYEIDRGIIQNLLNAAASFAVSVVRFCQELEEFWIFVDLLNTFSKKLTFCCASELEHIMGLPFVKYGRAMQLYKAGFKTMQSIAKTSAEVLQTKIEFMPKRVAEEIIYAAKMILLQRVENLRAEVEEVLDGLEI